MAWYMPRSRTGKLFALSSCDDSFKCKKVHAFSLANDMVGIMLKVDMSVVA
eukprot:CAMPEP_0178386660 /NCGR_PEP_ID=MMETSP0689_2-20121128/8675_1 /TAXON_ID=160604 /ORGANISM="Amphidinium massartii, Strain CS-259" /LENGTH=50 /DNA_ID=CAMNT_0020007005 /DNA_START=243 /DNA_END=395 /DNA_ORIENTATION=-